METLKILTGGGNVVLERVLTDERGPFLVIQTPSGPELAESAAADSVVFAALVRDEDGWVLASPDTATPVRCGTKNEGSHPLVPGSACSIGDYVFILDSDNASVGDVLLWSVDKSPIAAESIVSGRNVVAADSLRDGVMTVNPAVPGQELFTFFPTAGGLDVVMPAGGRMSVPRGYCFAVGGFEGVLLPAADASKALKTSRPFAYPSRGIRRRLALAVIGAIALFLGAAFLMQRACKVEALADQPHGIARIDGVAKPMHSAYSTDEYAYLLAFFRDLPSVLGARPSPVSRDLIARGESLSNTQLVARTGKFLKSVVAIQESVVLERWDELSNHLAKVDRDMFVTANGLAFLRDAQEVSDFANLTVPASGLRICKAGADERLKIECAITNAVSGLTDNLFIAAKSLNAFCLRLNHQYEVLNAYFNARDRIASHPDAVVRDEIEELRLTYLEVMHADDSDIPGVVDTIRADLSELSAKWLERLLGEFEKNQKFTVELSAVGTVYDLAADVVPDEAKLKAWKVRKQAVARQGEKVAREAYQRYRLLPRDRRAEAIKLLDEIIAIGSVGGKFPEWAAQEKARIEKEGEGK